MPLIRRLLIGSSYKGPVQGVHQFDNEGFIVVVVNPLITFITAIESIDVAASMSELGQTLALVGLADAVRCSARSGLVSQPACSPLLPVGSFHTASSRQSSLRNTARPQRSPASRRRARPLCPRSAVGRPLTAVDCVDSRHVSD